MKQVITLLFLLPFTFSPILKKTVQDFDRAGFYAAMKAGEMSRLDNEIALVQKSSFAQQKAFEGALLMRKSGLEKKASDKLKFFKEGRIKLETAILNEPSNAEYRFLRLTIQENAPKQVKYKTNIDEDKKMIIKSYKNLLPAVQNAVIDYSKNSDILKPGDFN